MQLEISTLTQNLGFTPGKDAIHEQILPQFEPWTAKDSPCRCGLVDILGVGAGAVRLEIFEFISIRDS